MTTNFSSFPWSSLPRLGRAEAAQLSAIARWLAITPSRGDRLRRLLRLDAAALVDARIVSPVVRASATTDDAIDPHARTVMRGGAGRFDPHAAVCEVRVDGVACEVRGASMGVRAIAQRLLGGPDEIAAPRPLTSVEEGLWCLVVATGLEDLGVVGQVWPARDLGVASGGVRVDLDVALGDVRCAVHVRVPEGVQLHVPRMRATPSISSGSAPGIGAGPRSPSQPRASTPAMPAERPSTPAMATPSARASTPAMATPSARASTPAMATPSARASTPAMATPSARPSTSAIAIPSSRPSWLDRVRFDMPIVVGRCAIARDDLERLAVRSVVTLERPARGQAELAVFEGAIGLDVRPGALAGEVVTGYVPRDMSLPEAHVELTVALGTTQLSLREITELAVGQIVQLGRPLAGPFELRAGGRVLGRGELVDVDGELAVRIVSLGD